MAATFGGSTFGRHQGLSYDQEVENSKTQELRTLRRPQCHLAIAAHRPHALAAVNASETIKRAGDVVLHSGRDLRRR